MKTAYEGHGSYRLFLASVRTDSPSCWLPESSAAGTEYPSFRRWRVE